MDEKLIELIASITMEKGLGILIFVLSWKAIKFLWHNSSATWNKIFTSNTIKGKAVESGKLFIIYGQSS